MLSHFYKLKHLWVNYDDIPYANLIFDLVEDITGVPMSNFVSIQLVHYGPQQHYYAHHDYSERRKGHEDRLLALLCYLNDPIQGGETAFVYSNGGTGRSTYPYNIKECTGFKVSPKKGNCILWYNLTPGGQMSNKPDALTAHMGCDVIEGVKWALNIWAWNTEVTSELLQLSLNDF